MNGINHPIQDRIRHSPVFFALGENVSNPLLLRINEILTAFSDTSTVWILQFGLPSAMTTSPAFLHPVLPSGSFHFSYEGASVSISAVCRPVTHAIHQTRIRLSGGAAATFANSLSLSFSRLADDNLGWESEERGPCGSQICFIYSAHRCFPSLF